MDLVDKWTTDGKINDGKKNTLDTYWRHFEYKYKYKWIHH